MRSGGRNVIKDEENILGGNCMKYFGKTNIIGEPLKGIIIGEGRKEGRNIHWEKLNISWDSEKMLRESNYI